MISTATTISSMQPGDSIPVTDQQGQLNLVQAARAEGVRHFIYVSYSKNVDELAGCNGASSLPDGACPGAARCLAAPEPLAPLPAPITASDGQRMPKVLDAVAESGRTNHPVELV